MSPTSISTLLLSLFLLIPTANATPNPVLQFNNNGYLTGVDGITVDYKLYNVTFAYGSCNQVFSQCTNQQDPFVSTPTDLITAGQTLADILASYPSYNLEQNVSDLTTNFYSLYQISLPWVTGRINEPNNNPGGDFTIGATDVEFWAIWTAAPTATLTISPTNLPAGTYNSSYSQTLTASGGTAPYSFSQSSGSLPPGMTFSSQGQLTGTPSAAGTYNFTVQVTDSTTTNGPLSGSQVFAFVVNPTKPAAPTLLKLVAGNGLMRVFFTPPADTGGTSLTYTATCTSGGSNFTGTSSSSPVTVTGLTNGVSYTCSVEASNSAGSSPASASLVKTVSPHNLTPVQMLLLD